MNVVDKAFALAAAKGLMTLKAERFKQGYVHYHQEKSDLLGKCEFYDAGYEAAKAGL